MLATHRGNTAYEEGRRLARRIRTARRLGRFAASPVREDSPERHMPRNPCLAAIGGGDSENASRTLQEAGRKYACVESRFIPPERFEKSRKHARGPLAGDIRESVDFRRRKRPETGRTSAVAKHGHGGRSTPMIISGAGAPDRKSSIRIRVPRLRVPFESAHVQDFPDRVAIMAEVSQVRRKGQVMPTAGQDGAGEGDRKARTRRIFAMPAPSLFLREGS